VAGGDGLESSSEVEVSSAEEESVVGSTSEVSPEVESSGEEGGVGGKAVPETLVSSPAIVADTVGVAVASPSTVTVAVAPVPLESVEVELRQVHADTSGT